MSPPLNVRATETCHGCVAVAAPAKICVPQTMVSNRPTIVRDGACVSNNPAAADLNLPHEQDLALKEG